MRTGAVVLFAIALAGCAEATPSGGAAPAISGYGLSVRLPTGWDGRISHGIVAAATFAIPPGDTGFGPRTARRLERRGGLLLLLSEYEGLAGDRRPCLPRRHPRPIGRSLRGSSFCLSGRHFVLFVRARHVRPAQVAGANRLLRSLTVRPGDFYPGDAPPARFPSRPDWHVGSSGPRPIRAEGAQTGSWAATVPYRDEPFQLAPHRTLERLPRDGILIWLGLVRDSRGVGYRRENSLRIDPRKVQTGFEGVPARFGLYRADVPRAGHMLDLWVFFGSPRPSARTIARAQAMLDAAWIPAWRWR